MFSGCIKGTASAISLWFLVKMKLNFKQLIRLNSVEARHHLT